MLIIILAYLGGVLTIASPCILPVLPFVFARSDQSFLRSGLPLLAGMAVTFTLVATLAAIGGGWVVHANQYGRWLALVLMALFGVALLFPFITDRAMQPLVSAGNRMTEAVTAGKNTQTITSFMLGIATGLLWAPCAGPILGLVLTGAALQGANVGSTLLLLAYAAGAVTSLMLALLIGGKVFAAMKRSLGAGEWIRKGIGAAILLGVIAISLGLDTGVLARISTATTGGGAEQWLVNKFGLNQNPNQNRNTLQVKNHENGQPLPGDYGPMPLLNGAVTWLNSPPLDAEMLRGKVVLVDFWTYSCINCLRTLPYVKAWAAKYHAQGLVVIGVHAPEFAFERDISNVIKESKKLGITYPIAVDNDYRIWRAFNNQYWPAHYFIDATGKVRHQYFGEGDYEHSERIIQQLLRDAGAKNVNTSISDVDAKGIELAASNNSSVSPETYLGFSRSENFDSDNKTTDAATEFSVPAKLELNSWALQGNWTIGAENVTLNTINGRIVYQFHARDLHLVLGPQKNGKPVNFRVTLDGNPPGKMHGVDISASGDGIVTDQRLYQLIRQSDTTGEHTFSIEFFDTGVNAYAFTFG